MKIYGLHGKSGTGKSYQAMNLCRDKNIESIIDDGLFIARHRVLAGTSAKRQPSKIKAIKTALFTDDEHCQEVKHKIAEEAPDSILVLGTSEEMVYRIVRRLDLPEPYQMISIEDITSKDQREIARKQRKDLGKHVIPAPTVQIKRQFSGYFLDPLRIFRGMNKNAYTEKTVVRPTYSYLGDYRLDKKVVEDIVKYVGRKTEGVDVIKYVGSVIINEGIEIDAHVILEYGTMIMETAKVLQTKIGEEVEAMTAYNIHAVNISVKGLK